MDLTTKYMSLELRSPLLVGASPVGADLDKLRSAVEAGAGAVVLPSIFEEQLATEQIALNYYLEQGTERFAESLTYFPEMEDYQVGPEQYLSHLAKAKEAVDVPVIGSINGVSAGGWIDFASRIQEAGADGIEMNIYLIPTNPSVDASSIEQVYEDILRAVKERVRIPVAVKLSPFLTATAHTARELEEAGADALVLFNRFYQPDLDVDNLEVTPKLVLSTSEELRLRLRWMAILHGRVRSSLAVTGGVHTGLDAAKAVLAGADAVQVVSALLLNGPDHLARIRAGMEELLAAKGYGSIEEARGVLSQRNCPEPAAFERANYMRILQNWSGPWSSGTDTPLPSVNE
jgi:dihydroorotate dehydrogenase (fumarate)